MHDHSAESRLTRGVRGCASGYHALGRRRRHSCEGVRRSTGWSRQVPALIYRRTGHQSVTHVEDYRRVDRASFRYRASPIFNQAVRVITASRHRLGLVAE